MKTSLAVALGSGLGGLLRVLVAAAVAHYTGKDGSGSLDFPSGILAVNAAGSVFIGLFAAVFSPGARFPLGEAPRQFLLAGVCGGFTTFSLFSLQTLLLCEAGHFVMGALYAGSTLVSAIGGAWLGWWGGGFVNRRFVRPE